MVKPCRWRVLQLDAATVYLWLT